MTRPKEGAHSLECRYVNGWYVSIDDKSSTCVETLEQIRLVSHTLCNISFEATKGDGISITTVKRRATDIERNHSR
jgi:hypothetical protein